MTIIIIKVITIILIIIIVTTTTTTTIKIRHESFDKLKFGLDIGDANKITQKLS